MSPLKNVVIRVNPFVEMTEASLKGEVCVVDLKKEGVLATALEAARGEPALVVFSGVVVELDSGDLPPAGVLAGYDLAAARAQVFSDHKSFSRFYRYHNQAPNARAVDLSVFVINPARWASPPTADQGALRDRKILAMPRYMNHKTDVLFETCISAYEALKYGMLGNHAAILNYLPCIEKGEASVIERYAYCFERLAPYVEALPRRQRDQVLRLIERTTIAKFREAMGQALGYGR